METERLKIFIDITKRKSSPTKSEGSMPLSKRKSSCPLSNEFLSSPPNKDGIEFIEKLQSKTGKSNIQGEHTSTAFGRTIIFGKK